MKEKIIDLYPFLSKKRQNHALSRIAVSLNWVHKDHRRRLEAYTVLASYVANLSNEVRAVSEEYLNEYGDANFVCTTMSSAVIGDKVSIACVENPDMERYFKRWATEELFFPKLVANEYKASNLGDCVYTLSWSPKRNRVRVRTIDAGYWFPFDIDTDNERHIFAWEEELLDGTEAIYKEEYSRNQLGSGKAEVNLTAGWYRKDHLKPIDALSLIRYAHDESGRELNNVSLGIDFFPIVYFPNIYREGETFGESDLTGVLSILDQLNNAYTDQAKNSWLMGQAMLWTDKDTFDLIPIDAETKQKIIRIGGGRVIPGKAGVVDNSNINKALIEYEQNLDRKLRQNSFIGDLAAGSQQSSSADRTTGILQIKGGILQRVVDIKRLMRQAKYDRLLKYVWRMSLIKSNDDKLKGILGSIENEDNQALPEIQFGNVLPVDQTALLSNLEKIKDKMDDEDFISNVKEAGIKINKVQQTVGDTE